MRATHATAERKYTTIRSFLQRVVAVKEHNLLVNPLWVKGRTRSVPKEQCKLISTFIPELMRLEAQQLYPCLPWIESTAGRVATTGRAAVERIASESRRESTDSTSSRQKRRRQ